MSALDRLVELAAELDELASRAVAEAVIEAPRVDVLTALVTIDDAVRRVRRAYLVT